MKTIYFIGLMGVGKSTIGKAVAEELQLPFFDVDQIVVNQTGKSIEAIFKEFGEAGFRKLETSVLKKLPKKNAIVATGGGIVESAENRGWMKRHGTVIFLQAETEEILARIGDDSGRPLLSRLVELSQTRKPLYETTATFKLRTTGKKVEEVVEECLNILHIG